MTCIYSLCIVLVMLVVQVCSCLGKSVPRSSPKMEEIHLREVVPEEYDIFERTAARQSSTRTANAAMNLLQKTRKLIEKRIEAGETYSDVADAYRSAWALCIRTARKATEPEIKELIVREWNESLTETLATPSQICALGVEWDRRFLTQRFWQLIKETDNAKIVAAACFAIWRGGSEDDWSKLEEKEMSTENQEIIHIVQNALSWNMYRKRKNTDEPRPRQSDRYAPDVGPAKAPPRLVR